LWRHTCFEFFVGPTAAPEYLEFNLSPSGEWALYHFRDARDALPNPDASPPEVQVRRDGRDLQIGAVLSATGWPVAWLEDELQVGLSVVLQARSGALAYYALHHAREEPDFHDRRGWTARLQSTVPREQT
jgi:hypothetical protein